MGSAEVRIGEGIDVDDGDARDPNTPADCSNARTLYFRWLCVGKAANYGLLIALSGGAAGERGFG